MDLKSEWLKANCIKRKLYNNDIYEFIKPYILTRIINTCFACIDVKGTHYSVKLTQKYMSIMKREYEEYYILKLDIMRLNYPSNRSEYISDKLLLELTHKFIYDNEESLSIPIGNYTSQYYGIIS